MKKETKAPYIHYNHPMHLPKKKRTSQRDPLGLTPSPLRPHRTRRQPITRLGQLIRLPPGRFASKLHVSGVSRAGARESSGRGSLLHGAVAAAELGAYAGGEVGDKEDKIAEEGLQDGEAAADDGEVYLEGPVVIGCVN